MKPVVLIATTCRWLPAARLGIALAHAGCTVDAVSPWHNPIRVTSSVRRNYDYHGLVPLRTLGAAISRSRPNIIFPCDDLAVLHLHKLYERERSHGSRGQDVCALIERSLGDPSNFDVVRKRTAFMKLAAEEGICVPETGIISDVRDLQRWVDRVGLPTVLKADGTSGGDGVRIIRSIKEGEHAFGKLQSPPFLGAHRKASIGIPGHDSGLANFAA